MFVICDCNGNSEANKLERKKNSRKASDIGSTRENCTSNQARTIFVSKCKFPVLFPNISYRSGGVKISKESVSSDHILISQDQP